jgi:hypothetical protein
MEEAPMTEANAPLDPTVWEELPPDPAGPEEPYDAGELSTESTSEAPPFEAARGAGGPDRYQHGKVPATILSVTTETSERPYVCCGYSSAQMAARTAKAGVSSDLKREGHAIRSKGGRRHNAGSNPTELLNGLQRALGVDVDPVTTSSIPGRLRAGYAVVAPLEYARLPEYLKVQGGSFGHSVCLFGWRADSHGDLVGYFDPLWSQGAAGAWARWSEVAHALWSSGSLTTKAKVPPPPPPAPPAPSVTLRYSGTRYGPRTATVKGDRTHVRTSPYIRNDNHKRWVNARDHFAVAQRTTRGSSVNGSTTWYGNAAGTEWVHSSVVRF